MKAKRITVLIGLGILFTLLFSTNLYPTIGLEPSAIIEPGAGSSNPDFPTQVKYTNNSSIFADYPDLWGIPSGIDYENGIIKVTLRVYKPDGSEIPGNVTDGGLLPGEEPPNPYERLTLVWTRTGGGELPGGNYRAVVEWVDTHSRIDEWTFTVGQVATAIYFQVFDGDQLLSSFDTLDAAKNWAQTKAYELKKSLVIKSSKTGEVVATVEYTPPPLGILIPPIMTGPLASLVGGRLGSIRGTVSIVDVKGNPFTIRIGQDIPLNAYIATSKDSGAEIKVGENKVELKENTVIMLISGPLASLMAGRTVRVTYYRAIGAENKVSEKQLGYDLPKYSTKAIQADSGIPRIMLFEGKLSVDVTKVEPTTGFKIYTPVSVVEAKGTKFDLSVTDEGLAQVKVLDGEVAFSDLVEGKSVTVKEGETSQVTPTTTPTAPRKTTAIAGVLGILPVWAWITISAVTGVIITLLIVIVILLIVRRGPKIA